MENDKNIETGCCPRFDPEKFDDKEITYNDKLFIKDHVKSLFHIPLNFGQVMTRDVAMAEKADALPKEDQMVLTDETSMWGADTYMAVDKEVPEAEMAKISGTFVTKVFEGPYKDMRKFIQGMDDHMKEKGMESKKRYFFYVYCPKCAKAYGRNYTVIFDQV